MEERKPLNSKSRILIMLPGDLISTSSKNTSFFFLKVHAQFYQLEFLQEDAVSTGRYSLSTGSADFLQEALYFYRKLPVEVQDSPEFMF